MSVCAVIPAYNEASRIHKVLDTLTQAPSVSEIIVVDDGSTDGTFDAVSQHPSAQAGNPDCKIRVLRHHPNRGKGAAMVTGAENTDAGIVLFLDADLVGLTIEQVESMTAPVISQQYVMALGVFRGGRGATTLAQILAPNISGQRCIRRGLFLSIPCVSKSGYGVELAITGFVMGEGLPIVRVVLKDVTHPMKEEKLGWIRGIGSRLRMYGQMFPYLLKRNCRR